MRRAPREVDFVPKRHNEQYPHTCEKCGLRRQYVPGESDELPCAHLPYLVVAMDVFDMQGSVVDTREVRLKRVHYLDPRFPKRPFATWHLAD